ISFNQFIEFMKDLIRQIEQFQVLNKLIDNRRTGNPDELAKKLGVSRSQLYLILEIMKDMGLKIAYSRKINSFFYEKLDRLSIVFKVKVLTTEEVKNTDGGKKFEQNLNHPIYWTE